MNGMNQDQLAAVKAEQRANRIRTTKPGYSVRYVTELYAGGSVRQKVPFEIAALAVGDNAWMRDVVAACACGKLATVRELYDGELPGHCAECSERFFRCDKCGGTHHPDDECTGKLNSGAR